MSLLLMTISCCSKYVRLGLYYFQISVPIVTVLVDVTLIICVRRIQNVTILIISAMLSIKHIVHYSL
jgi:hypothetical protein